LTPCVYLPSRCSKLQVIRLRKGLDHIFAPIACPSARTLTRSVVLASSAYRGNGAASSDTNTLRRRLRPPDRVCPKLTRPPTRPTPAGNGIQFHVDVRRPIRNVQITAVAAGRRRNISTFGRSSRPTSRQAPLGGARCQTWVTRTRTPAKSSKSVVLFRLAQRHPSTSRPGSDLVKPGVDIGGGFPNPFQPSERRTPGNVHGGLRCAGFRENKTPEAGAGRNLKTFFQHNFSQDTKRAATPLNTFPVGKGRRPCRGLRERLRSSRKSRRASRIYYTSRRRTPCSSRRRSGRR